LFAAMILSRTAQKRRRLWRSPKAILDKITAANKNAVQAIKAAF
jgi:hypothetical protein